MEVVEGANVGLALWLDVLDSGVLIFILYLFFTGKVMSSDTVDKILKEAENRTTKLGKEISDGIETAVYRGSLRARDEKDSQ